MNDPVPEKDAEYGISSTGLHTIFNAAEHDPLYKHRKEIDVVTDGNYHMCRKADEKEKKLLKQLAGRPRDIKPSKKPAAASAAMQCAAKKTKSKSRCKAVGNVEQLKPKRTRTGGLFATVDMRNTPSGTNQIIHLAEMLNTGNNQYKIGCLTDMKKSNIHVGKYAHDCGCVLANSIEGTLCKRVFLDGYHAKRHKCNFRRIQHNSKLNSQACEQLWSKLDRFKFITDYRKAHYRCFLRHLCIWRNKNAANVKVRKDTHVAISKRKMQKRKRQ